MSKVILGCEIIRDEIESSQLLTNNQDPIVWIDANYHKFPEKLRQKLQEEIDKIDKIGTTDEILLSFGYCGNAILGLQSQKSRLIIPKVSDCIDMLLSDHSDLPKLRASGCYFLTKGWMESKDNILNEYEIYIKKYGESRTKRIMQVMLAHYHHIALIDTGAYQLEDYLDEAENISKELSLQLRVEPGTLSLLIRLFSYDWVKDFLIIPAKCEITMDHFHDISISLSQGQS